MTGRAFTHVAMLACFVPWPAVGSESQATLKVAIFDCPPFATQNIAEKWEGLSAELWELLAGRLDLEFEYVKFTEDETIDRVASGELSTIVGGVPILAESEVLADFTLPYFSSRL